MTVLVDHNMISEDATSLVASVNQEWSFTTFELNEVTEEAWNMIAKGLERSKWNDFTDKAMQSRYERNMKIRDKCTLGFAKVKDGVDVYEIVKDRYNFYENIKYVSKDIVNKNLKSEDDVAVFAFNDMKVVIASNFMV